MVCGTTLNIIAYCARENLRHVLRLGRKILTCRNYSKGSKRS